MAATRDIHRQFRVSWMARNRHHLSDLRNVLTGRRKTKHRGRRLLVVLFSMLMLYSLYCFFIPHTITLHPYEFPQESKWIAPRGDYNYTAYLRKEFHFHAHVKHAWMVIAPYESFEIVINGNTLARHFLWRPTRPYQNGLSEFGQRIATSLPTLSLNFPREYQWTGHHNHAIPVWLDLTPSLTLGRNIICFELQTRNAPAKIRFYGEITLETGEVIKLTSDETWPANRVPRGVNHRKWCSRQIMNLDWAPARIVPAPAGFSLRHVPQESHTQPLGGEWMFSPQRIWDAGGRDPQSHAPVGYFFKRDWYLPEAPREAFLRVLATRRFYVFINGYLLDPNLPYAKFRTGEEWLINAKPPGSRLPPELLDPDEVGGVFVGKRFENSRHGDPTVNDFKPFENYMNTAGKDGYSWSDDPGSFTDRERGRVTDFKSAVDRPDHIVPKALTRNQAEPPRYYCYGIANLLRKGNNEIVIRAMDNPARDAKLVAAPKVAADMGATGISGRNYFLRSGPGWDLHIGSLKDPARETANFYPVTKLPRLRFHGHARIPTIEKVRCAAVTALLTLTVLLCYAIAFKLMKRNWMAYTQYLYPSVFLLGGALLLRVVMKENYEFLVFMFETTWMLLFVTAAILPMVFILGIRGLRFCRRQIQERLFDSAQPKFQPQRADAENRVSERKRLMQVSLDSDPQGLSASDEGRQTTNKSRAIWKTVFSHSTLIKVTVAFLLLVCGAARAYNMDLQTLDDDEYASVQAALAIARCGTPHFTDMIYYTRSPMHHYFAGACIKLFGDNLWVMRMGQVVCSVFTGLFLYLIGAHIFKKPWSGIIALFLFDFHPFLMFSGHVARFYQQQQLCAVILVYCFYYGFVEWRSA